VAVDALLGAGQSRETLLRCAGEGERAAAGVPHADNAGPSLVGGFLLLRGGGQEAEFESLPVPDGLCCAMLHPHLEVETLGARAVLPEHVPLRDAVTQWANVASLVVGLYEGDWDLIGSSIRDVVAEPARSPQVPGFSAVVEAARGSGALGCGLSGSGPSIFALCRGRDLAERVAQEMKEAFESRGVAAADAWTSVVGAAGARVIA
jgi:homoserine kinase